MLRLTSTLPRLAALAGVGIVCALASRTTSAVTAAALVASPRFEPGPCPFTPAADQVEGQTVTCGFVLVPENRTSPEGNWLRLAVAVFKGPTVATRPPLIFLGGGPGTFVLERFGPGVSGVRARDLTAAAISSCSISAVSGFHNHR